MSSAESVKHRIERLAEDPDMPEDVTEKVEKAASQLSGDDKNLSVRANSAAATLQEVGNDPNVSQHVRTEVWNLASKVESLGE